VSVLRISNLFVCAVFLTGGFALSPHSAVAQNSSICDGYARDYAQRNSRGRVAGGAARGAIGGALIGAIAGGAGVGALIGGGIGTVVGSDRKSRDFNVLYNSAFNRCMRG
jgi:uncharacterized membrane protein